jgi:hypothetical protein
MVVYIGVAVAVVVVTVIIIIMRYYKMLGDEGYLWFTLPVTANQHISGKLIVATVWSIASFVVIVLSILILVARLGLLGTIGDGVRYITERGFHLTPWIIGILVLLLIQGIAGILEFYAAMSIGPHFTKSRLGGSVIGYIIIYVGTQILAAIGLPLMTFVLENMSSAASKLFFGDSLNSLEVLTEPSIFAAIDLIGIVVFVYTTALNVILCVACYILSHQMVNKKLNLG